MGEWKGEKGEAEAAGIEVAAVAEHAEERACVSVKKRALKLVKSAVATGCRQPIDGVFPSRYQSRSSVADVCELPSGHPAARRQPTANSPRMVVMATAVEAGGSDSGPWWQSHIEGSRR